MLNRRARRIDLADPRNQSLLYRPGREVSRWFRMINKWMPIFFGSVAAVLFIGMPLGFEKIFIAVARWIIAPLKPFLLVDGPGHLITFGWIETAAWPIIWILGAVMLFMTIREAMKATNLVVNDDGISVVRSEKHNVGGRYGPVEIVVVNVCLRALDWSDVVACKLVRPAGTRSHMDYLIEIESDRQGPLVIKYGDIEEAFGRMQFVGLLEKHLGDRFDPEIQKVFSEHGERESYTELWLKELNAPPKRDKLVPLPIGLKLHNGEYLVKEKIGIGGQGAVYLAESTKTQSEVAIKEFILPVYPDPRVRKSAAERFQTEAELISRINHPQIVHFVDLFIEDHRAYLVLERVKGRDLKQVVEQDGPMSEERVIALALQMCDILTYLHDREPPIAHRDFTPDNLMLGEHDVLKLIDFSVAQAAVSNVTGSVVGKAEYIAPEQFRGKPIPLSDIYSLGGTLYFLLTGRNPEAISVSRPDTCSKGLSEVIARATALDPSQRFASAAEMRQCLQSIATAGGVIDLRIPQKDRER